MTIFEQLTPTPSIKPGAGKLAWGQQTSYLGNGVVQRMQSLIPGGRSLSDAIILRAASFGDIWDPSWTTECSNIINQHIFEIYQTRMALAPVDQSNAIEFTQQRIDYILPPGQYNIANQINVLEGINLICQGYFQVAAGGNLGAYTSVPSANVLAGYTPAVTLAPYGHIEHLNLQCNQYIGNSGSTLFSTSGLVVGKTYSVSSIAFQTRGGGHQPGDVLTFFNPSIYFNGAFVAFQITVSTVDSNGKILTATISNSGIYSLPPSLQPISFTQVSTTGSGVGCTVIPTWNTGTAATDFPGNSYNLGTTTAAATKLGQLNIFGVGYGFSASYGAQTCCWMNCTNTEGYKLAMNGGLYGYIQPAGVYDCDISFTNTVLNYIPLLIQGNGFSTRHKCDTPLQSAIVLQGAQDCRVSGYAFINPNNSSFWGGATPLSQPAFVIQGGSTQAFNCYLNYNTHNIGNAGFSQTLISLANCDNCTVIANTSNYTVGGGAANYGSSTFVNYGSSVGSGCYVGGSASGFTQGLVTGSPAGFAEIWDDQIPDGYGGFYKGRFTLAGGNGIYHDIWINQVPTGGLGTGTGHGKTPAGSTLNANTGMTYKNYGSSANPQWAASNSLSVIQTLTYSATTQINAYAGGFIRMTLTGNLTLSAPINMVDGQDVRIELTQGTGGNFTLTLNAVFDVGSIGTITLSTTAGKADIIEATYDATLTKWLIKNFVKGY